MRMLTTTYGESVIFDAQVGDLGAERTHAEWHNVHRAPAHTPFRQIAQSGIQFPGIDPVVRRTRVGAAARGHVGPPLDARDIARVGSAQEAVRALLRVERDECAVLDHQLGEALVLRLRTVAPFDAVRIAELSHLLDPIEQATVLGGRTRIRPGAFFRPRCWFQAWLISLVQICSAAVAPARTCTYRAVGRWVGGRRWLFGGPPGMVRAVRPVPDPGGYPPAA